MSAITANTVLLTFLLFCRIGGCLMLMPGFASTRVPVQVRLLIAVAATLALAPLLLPVLSAALPALPAPTVLALLVSETTLGALIGLMGRLFFLALQFMASAAAMFVGFNASAGVPLEDNEPVPAMTALVTLTATLLFFLTDQHWEVLRALVASYMALPVSDALAADFTLAKLADALSSAFVLALQISSPFIIYALLINFMIGLANKFTPQIPVYFIAVPFVLAGGFFILYLTIGDALRFFMLGFMGWLARG
ncbi:MAG TPA: flagellar biosynthetic protein FliR [Hyphomicrobiaceae bacterium]|jgi:flagellar biosynthetic protein FliR|nr:flagellar biosynthetic protein FliR [Hyphomicrobiaceae bacterium]